MCSCTPQMSCALLGKPVLYCANWESHVGNHWWDWYTPTPLDSRHGGRCNFEIPVNTESPPFSKFSTTVRRLTHCGHRRRFYSSHIRPSSNQLSLIAGHYGFRQPLTIVSHSLCDILPVSSFYYQRPKLFLGLQPGSCDTCRGHCECTFIDFSLDSAHSSSRFICWLHRVSFYRW